MGKTTGIEWCDHTANIWIGCTKIHEGCDNCYAETWANRGLHNSVTIWGNAHPRQAVKSVWNNIQQWQKVAAKDNVIRRVFVNSLSDIFEKEMFVIDHKGDDLYTDDSCIQGLTTKDLRNRLFALIPNCPNLLFLLLTKRPSNINKMIPAAWLENPPANVMFGTSPANQATADNLIPMLLKVKGKKFLSIEPQLSEIDLTGIKGNAGSVYQVLQPIIGRGDMDRDAIEWVIQGGESGAKKRPFNLEWARKIRNQCKEYNVAYFFKQIDKIQEIPEDLQIRQFNK